MATLPVMTCPEPPGYAAYYAEVYAQAAAVNRALAALRQQSEVRVGLPGGLDVIVTQRDARCSLLVRRLGVPVTLSDVTLCCMAFGIPQESAIVVLPRQRSRSRAADGQLLYWHGLTLTWQIPQGHEQGGPHETDLEHRTVGAAVDSAGPSARGLSGSDDPRAGARGHM